MKIKDFHKVELNNDILTLKVKGELEIYTWNPKHKNLVIQWLEDEIDIFEYYQELPWFLIEK